MTSLLNLEALRNAPVQDTPFPHFTVDHAIDTAQVMDVIDDFPQIPAGGSYTLSDVDVGPDFQRLLDDVDTPEFRQLLGQKFDVDVSGLPLMVTLRGHSRGKDGRIHADSRTKVLTILIYLNKSWPHQTGRLRILRSKSDMHDYAAEVPAGPGQLIAFKVTDNGWHGYLPHEGRRQSIQINFLTSAAAGSKHRFVHGLSARLKALRHRR